MRTIYKKTISLFLTLMMIVPTFFAIAPQPVFAAAPTVTYRTHVQTYGWKGWVSNGATGGTTGEGKRMEAIQIKVSGVSGGIQYRAHVQTYGWQNWVSNGATAGTTGQSKRMEAIQIKLTGAIAQSYDIYYRSHVQTIGWTNWAKNGAVCGSTGIGKRMEALQIKLVAKTSTAKPTGSGNASYSVARKNIFIGDSGVATMGWAKGLYAYNVAVGQRAAWYGNDYYAYAWGYSSCYTSGGSYVMSSASTAGYNAICDNSNVFIMWGSNDKGLDPSGRNLNWFIQQVVAKAKTKRNVAVYYVYPQLERSGNRSLDYVVKLTKSGITRQLDPWTDASVKPITYMDTHCDASTYQRVYNYLIRSTSQFS